MIPILPRSVLWPTLRTSVMVWLFLRLFMGAGARYLAGGMEMGGGGGSHGLLSLSASVLLMAGVAVSALVDLHLAREEVWVQNLGVSRKSVAGAGLVVAGILESGLWMASGIWGWGG